MSSTNPELSEQSRELFRLVVENVRDFAVYTKSLDGHTLSWNPGVERLLGYSEDEWVGLHISVIFTPEDLARGGLDWELKTALEHGRAEDQRWHVRKDGSRFWANGLLTLLRDEAGRPCAFAKIMRDDTARHRAEEEARRARDELEQRVEERTRELSELTEVLLDAVKERKAAEAQARELLRRIVDVQEIERRRVARDLHDNLGQQLTALNLKLSYLRQMCGERAELCGEVEEAQAMLKRLDEEVDFLAWELRPASLDVLGLPAAVGTFVREWSEHYGIGAEFHAVGFDGLRLKPEAEINLYRVAQEALNNVSKHAGARNVAVLLERRDDHVVLVVEDDGEGFNPGRSVEGERGMGLLNMRERAEQVGGALEIESEPGAGTTVYACVPVGETARSTTFQS
jgi:PAS domain S-box-containing protein